MDLVTRYNTRHQTSDIKTSNQPGFRSKPGSNVPACCLLLNQPGSKLIRDMSISWLLVIQAERHLKSLPAPTYLPMKKKPKINPERYRHRKSSGVVDPQPTILTPCLESTLRLREQASLANVRPATWRQRLFFFFLLPCLIRSSCCNVCFCSLFCRVSPVPRPASGHLPSRTLQAASRVLLAQASHTICAVLQSGAYVTNQFEHLQRSLRLTMLSPVGQGSRLST